MVLQFFFFFCDIYTINRPTEKVRSGFMMLLLYYTRDNLVFVSQTLRRPHTRLKRIGTTAHNVYARTFCFSLHGWDIQ